MKIHNSIIFYFTSIYFLLIDVITQVNLFSQVKSMAFSSQLDELVGMQQTG